MNKKGKTALISSLIIALIGILSVPFVYAAETREVVDMAGRHLTIPVRPKSVACMQGPTYEMVFAMGGKDQIGLVRDDHVSAYPLALLTNPDLKNYR